MTRDEVVRVWLVTDSRPDTAFQVLESRVDGSQQDHHFIGRLRSGSGITCWHIASREQPPNNAAHPTRTSGVVSFWGISHFGASLKFSRRGPDGLDRSAYLRSVLPIHTLDHPSATTATT